MKTRIISAIIGGLLAVGVTAAPVATAQESSVEQSRTQIVVTVDANAAVAFKFFNITLSALQPATGSTPAFTFPSSRNQLVGGVKFTANDKCFAFYAPKIDTAAGVVKAWVSSGDRINFFSLNGQSLVLTAEGATALNAGLGFDGLFTEGFVFGTYATSAA